MKVFRPSDSVNAGCKLAWRLSVVLNSQERTFAPWYPTPRSRRTLFLAVLFCSTDSFLIYPSLEGTALRSPIFYVLLAWSKSLDLPLVLYIQWAIRTLVQGHHCYIHVCGLKADSTANLRHWIRTYTLFLAFEVMLLSVFILSYFIPRVFSQRVVQVLNLTKRWDTYFSSESSPSHTEVESALVTSALNNGCSRHDFLIPSNRNSHYLGKLFYPIFSSHLGLKVGHVNCKEEIFWYKKERSTFFFMGFYFFNLVS